MQKFSSVDDNIGSRSFLSRVSRQGRNYSNLVAWTLYTGFQGRTTKLAVAIGISLLSLASQAAAIGAIYWYGRQMETSGHASVPYLHIEMNLNDRPEWLWGVVIFSSICFVISAAFLYLGRSQIMNIAEQHYARKLEQLVLESFRLPDPRVRLASKLLQERWPRRTLHRVPAWGHYRHQLRLCRHVRRRGHWRGSFLALERRLADTHGLCLSRIRSLVSLPTDIARVTKRKRS